LRVASFHFLIFVVLIYSRRGERRNSFLKIVFDWHISSFFGWARPQEMPKWSDSAGALVALAREIR